jgi:hypothetical protein
MALEELREQNQHETILVDQLQKYLEMKTGRKYNMWELGNNLKILEAGRFVKHTKCFNATGAVRKEWKLTNREYVEEESVAPILIALPALLFARISKAARYKKTHKTTLIVKMLKKSFYTPRWVNFFRKMDELEKAKLEKEKLGEVEELAKIEDEEDLQRKLLDAGNPRNTGNFQIAKKVEPVVENVEDVSE